MTADDARVELVAFCRNLGGAPAVMADLIEGLGPDEIGLLTPTILRTLKTAIYGGEAATPSLGVQGTEGRGRRR